MASITEKRGKDGEIISYRFRACVGRDTSERQIWRTATIKRPDGLTPARERKEVERLADKWEQEQRAAFQAAGALRTAPDRITLHSFIDDHFIADFVEDGQHASNTVSYYKYMCETIKAYFSPKKHLAAISTEEAKRFSKWLNTEARTKNGEPYSKASIRHTFKCFNAILQYAKRLKYIKENPVDYLTAKEKPHSEHKEIDFLPPDEAREFMAALKTEPLFWQAFISLLMTSGLRRGEAVGLQWGDLDTKRGELHIERNATYTPQGVNIGQTKGKRARTVPVAAGVVKLLQQLRQEQRAKFGAALDSAYIFCSEVDATRPICPTAPTKWTARFIAKHGLPDVSPHDLRHSAASLALEAGASLKEIQELLGHADASTTLKFYAGVTEERKRKAVDGIERLLSGTD